MVIKMKFKELSKYWKRTVVTLSVLTVLFALIFVGLVAFMTNMRSENEAKRNLSKKPDSELIGQRLVIERKGEGDIHANVYIPKTASDEKLPVLFNAHGGGFFLGGADEISQQSPQYQKVLKEAGVPYTVKEYEGGQHPFIHSPYPEFQKGLSEEEKAVFATEEQFALSRQAEADIKEWLKSINN